MVHYSRRIDHFASCLHRRLQTDLSVSGLVRKLTFLLYKDHWHQGRSKPGCRIVWSAIKLELTTGAEIQLWLIYILLYVQSLYCHSGLLDVRHVRWWRIADI